MKKSDIITIQLQEEKLKEQQARIETLERANNDLEKANQSFRKRLKLENNLLRVNV
jgi:cell shape-determining protein MreC